MIEAVVRRGRLLLAQKCEVFLVTFFLVSFFGGPDAVAVQRLNREPLRPSSYTLEIQSTRSEDKPRIVSTWAHVVVDNEHYRALMPSNIVRGPEVVVDFHWAVGSSAAGEAEKVELEWKGQSDSAWQSRLLGEGFREPGNGRLMLSPTKLHFPPEGEGFVDLRFLMLDALGRVLQDGGMGSTTKIQVAAQKPEAVLQFTNAWTVAQQGQLRAGKSFDLVYALERIEQQLTAAAGGDSSPWCLLAKVQFDDGPILNYPLLASHFKHPEKVVGLLPTVQIPEQARRVTIWFFAVHNTQTYFDSNFGQNYHFIILPS